MCVERRLAVAPQSLICLCALAPWFCDFPTRNTAKYEYGILALERATECFWECSGRTKRYARLVRRVTRITSEHGDTKRCVVKSDVGGDVGGSGDGNKIYAF